MRLVYADVKIFEKRICMKCHSLLNQLQKDPGNWINCRQCQINKFSVL